MERNKRQKKWTLRRRTKGNGQELEDGRFWANIRKKKNLTKSMIKHCNEFPERLRDLHP